MSDPKDEDEDKTPGAELREGLRHLFSAARKVIKTAEPAVTRSLDDAERVISKIGRGGEVVAGEVGKEVATLATRLAEKLRQVANREDGHSSQHPPESAEHDHDEPKADEPPKV